MREQTGQVFHKGKSWFVRYCDDVMQPDGTIRRKRVCKKLSVDFCDEYRTRKSVQSFVDEILAPVNGGLLNPQSTMPVTEFVEKVYLPEYVEKQLRAATLKQYRDVWEDHLKARMGKLTLRGRLRLKRPSDAVPSSTSKPFCLACSNRPKDWGFSTASTPFRT